MSELADLPEEVAYDTVNELYDAVLTANDEAKPFKTDSAYLKPELIRYLLFTGEATVLGHQVEWHTCYRKRVAMAQMNSERIRKKCFNCPRIWNSALIRRTT